MPHEIVGHAIVSADGKIATADGDMPAELRNDLDFQRFQSHLDRANLVVVGRQGHERHPNPGRKRLVATTSVHDLSPDPADKHAHFWNPSGLSFESALAALGVPADGNVAITGVFDLFRERFTAFDLAESNIVLIRDGQPCFSTGHPRLVLADCGLFPVSFEPLDPQANVTLTRWRRLSGSDLL
ncbi:hypothetical protein GCM10007913_39250 [Devosia yakushimensis]|uniref:Dihydrofolate reductase n=1 Tax=Devosia yakushimensis TaxID=470028 RepID=A0ABQ5UIW9_9HYPH|nr:dihydrofolate reductase [Devosia yakushimensis]GLQ11993.1 hypothetical protein GCM10007913_39250 [Devosia yakushimensis]